MATSVRMVCTVALVGLTGCATRYVYDAEAHPTAVEEGTTVTVTSENARVEAELLKATDHFKIRLEIENVGAEPLELRVSRILMEDGSGLVSSAMEPDEAIGHVYGRSGSVGVGFGVGTYGSSVGTGAGVGYSASRARERMLESGLIPPGKRRAGLVYFAQVPERAKLRLDDALSREDGRKEAVGPLRFHED